MLALATASSAWWFPSGASTRDATVDGIDLACPDTSAPFGLACGMKVVATAKASCSDVLEEMHARVDGQADGSWHDPHNRGTYAVQKYGGSFSTSRLTGDGKFTDKQLFTLTRTGSGSCQIQACSRSQVPSGLDAGTNYCNLKMLFCGSHDCAGGRCCKPLKHDFTTAGEQTEKFMQSSVDLGACLKV
ncbi:hypothetical protein EMIHUDRAFT_437026 [Emiliania huxleyi CCMP1516]|uniref:Pherophorin domain-containing protein n=2 Tax=Emiliania huxleyi TaxID=2903 RepID=A0A0D3IRE1_EMIH1|nr:hypothetical protein EMIHUDRAFT_437026 [Emiliania huxleyi CCMP1516]EOD13826.1 hypothetical protein EMIHUDRAFT_437026 [Emiliania huxleyi CCMP1516]|eukprot:XP_005766255.1 hypothetical protein EMIHUDRAFT_437026 [Emiliania huxleyi CCMP1516]